MMTPQQILKTMFQLTGWRPDDVEAMIGFRSPGTDWFLDLAKAIEHGECAEEYLKKLAPFYAIWLERRQKEITEEIRQILTIEILLKRYDGHKKL